MRKLFVRRVSVLGRIEVIPIYKTDSGSPEKITISVLRACDSYRREESMTDP